MTNNNYEDISYLLKKIEWPEPSRSLMYRIQNAATGEYDVPFISDMNVVHFKSPFLTFAAVTLALFLSVASGVMAGGTESATQTQTAAYPYTNSSSLSVTGIYSGQIQ